MTGATVGGKADCPQGTFCGQTIQVKGACDARTQLLVISEAGDMLLLAANPERHLELGRFRALAGKTWNHPVGSGVRSWDGQKTTRTDTYQRF
jgi:hypothetical protein